MTLVLASYVSDSVVMAADSRVVEYPTGRRSTDRKLFYKWGMGVTSYGQGPPGVPAAIDDLQGAPTGIGEAISLLQKRFSVLPRMCALIGAIENGNPCLYRASMMGQREHLIPEFGKPIPIWRGGCEVSHERLAAGSDSAAELVERMLGILRWAAQEERNSVGPPFCYLIVRADGHHEMQTIDA